MSIRNGTSLALTGVCLAAALLSGTARADAGITVSETTTGGSLVQVRKGVVRSSSPADPGNYVLFDTKTGGMTMVDAHSRTYSSTTPEALRQHLSGAMQQMEMMRQQMQAQLQNMPPEQRAMMERQMGTMGGMPPGAAGVPAKPPLTIKAAGKDTINGIKCRWYEATRGGQAVGKTCVAKAGELGVSEADFKALRTAFGAFNDLGRELGGMGGSDEVFDPEKIPGLPIATHGPTGGSSVIKVSTDKLPAHLFSAPKGFSPRPLLPSMGRP